MFLSKKGTVVKGAGVRTPWIRHCKAKFHYASWFEAGRRQVQSWSATNFEPASVMEFGFKSRQREICIALYHDSSLKRSAVARVTFIHKWNESYLPLLPSRRASLHFGWISRPTEGRRLSWHGWLCEILR